MFIELLTSKTSLCYNELVNKIKQYKMFLLNGVLKVTTVCIINKKGGVAKTTTSLALGAGLRKKGYSVLYIDLDSQCNLSMCVGADVDGKNVLGVLTEQLSIDEAIQTTALGDILPAGLALAGADGVIVETGKEYRLREAINSMKVMYDFIVIDTPPSLGVLSINAMTASDWLIIPAQADMFSRDGLIQLDRAIRKDKQYCNPSLRIAGILLTRYSERNILSKNLKEIFIDLAEKMDTSVFQSSIREGIALKEAQVMHQSIFDYAPKSNGAEDYAKFVDEFLRTIDRKTGARG